MRPMSEATFILCAITSVVSAILLARGAPQGGRLLFWGSVFFAGMALNNILLFVDAWMGPTVDWSLLPNIAAFISIAILIYALIWETT